MKRSLSHLVGLAVLGLLVALAATVGQAARAADKDPIIIGFATAETGIISAFDKPAVIGAKMAIADLNKRGGILGRQIKVVNSDTKSDISQGSRAGDEVLQKGADAVLVTPDFNFGGGAAREADKAGKIAISMGAGSPKFGVQGIGPLAYTMGIAGTTDAAVIAEWGYQKKKWRTAYLLNDNTTDYDTGQCDGFGVRWKQLGGKVVGADTFKNGDPSIATQVTRIKGLSKQPDLIMLCSYPPGGAVAVKQLRDAGIKSAIASNGAMDGTYWFKNSIPKLSNFYYTTSASVFGNDPDKAINAFDLRYKKMTGDWPSAAWPIFGYTAMQALAYSMEKAGSTDGAKVAAVFNRFKKHPFLLTLTFTPQVHIDPLRPERIMQVQNGKNTVAAVASAQRQLPLFG
jgi:branched-chain amino acid transport system substrate-binding protein